MAKSLNSLSDILTFFLKLISSIEVNGTKWTWAWGTSSPMTEIPILSQSTAFFKAFEIFFENSSNLDNLYHPNQK